MTMQEAAPWIGIAFSSLFALATLLYTIISNNSKSYKQDMVTMQTQMAAIVGRVDMTEDKITRIETELDHLPNKDSLHKIAMGQVETNSHLQALAQRVEQLADAQEKMANEMANLNGKH